jgi:ubiquinone/menaquinone biosynthesis C-methylase UbiE
MNESHLHYLASAEWKARLETDLLPWIERVADLGDDVLEIGPGPGLTTDILRQRTSKVTAVEIDHALALGLSSRLRETNVAVVEGDAKTLAFDSNRFTAATAFSVLHHVPTEAEQDQILAAILRVLAPGAGLFVTDARDLKQIRDGHTGDTFIPLDATTLVSRLERIGFSHVELDTAEYEIRFTARKPKTTTAATSPR